MIRDIVPNQAVKGDFGSNTQPEALDTIALIMDQVFDMVCRQQDVTEKDLMVFMKQIGLK